MKAQETYLEECILKAVPQTRGHSVYLKSLALLELLPAAYARVYRVRVRVRSCLRLRFAGVRARALLECTYKMPARGVRVGHEREKGKKQAMEKRG